MKDWFVSWQKADEPSVCGYQVFKAFEDDPAKILAEQMTIIASHNDLKPRELLVIAFNKV